MREQIKKTLEAYEIKRLENGEYRVGNTFITLSDKWVAVTTVELSVLTEYANIHQVSLVEDSLFLVHKKGITIIKISLRKNALFT